MECELCVNRGVYTKFSPRAAQQGDHQAMSASASSSPDGVPSSTSASGATGTRAPAVSLSASRCTNTPPSRAAKQKALESCAAGATERGEREEVSLGDERGEEVLR
eukprot:4133642-Prymnesium_polylepis.1